MMRHFIGKQIFELRLSSSEEAWKKQDRLSRLYWDKIIPVLQSVFDRYSISGKVFKIDQLTIDLGELNVEELEKGSFIDLLEQKLEEQLKVILYEENPQGSVVPELKSEFEKWLYFLEFGSFPWAISLPGKDWLRCVMDTLAAESSAINNLQSLLLKNSTSIERLVRQHNDSFLKTIIEVFTGRNQDRLLEFWEEWSKFVQLDSNNSDTKHYIDELKDFWVYLLSELLPQRIHLQSEELIFRFLRSNLFDSKKENNVSLETFNPNGYPITFEILKSYKLSSNIVGKVSSIPHEIQNNTPPINQNTKSSQPADNIGVNESNESDTKLETDQNKNGTGAKNSKPEGVDSISIRQYNDEGNILGPITLTNLEEGDALYVHNAGVILLHPFLQRFFDTLDLTIRSQFVDQQSQSKAIHLIHYLASKSIGIPEYSLVLPKLLCGLAINMPLDHSIVFGKEVLEEAELLLQAALDHWAALGKSSPDALREGFLQREGKLEKRSTGLILTVEKKTIDILLDQLPWNLGMVKLPWMPELLRVDWR